MKKLVIGILASVIALVAIPSIIYANPGDMGFFGGITEGVRLPRTTEQLRMADVRQAATANINSPYKEMLFIGGVPVEFEGLIQIRRSGSVTDERMGTYRITYNITPSTATSPGAALNRNIVFEVDWYRPDDRQVVKNMSVVSWNETIVIDGTTYTLDAPLSFFEISIIQDNAPGVMYWRGHTSYRRVFNGREVTIEGSSFFYGVRTVWAHAESHVINEDVYHADWQMSYQVRSSVSAFKTLEYSANLPFRISFAGNHQEVLTTESGLVYNIFHLPNRFYGTPLYGRAYLETTNTFENLQFRDVSMWEPHWALEDIHRLYALRVLDMPVAMFNPSHNITRAQFTQMMVRALKIPVDDLPGTGSPRRSIDIVIFPDVRADERPVDFMYVMAAWQAGLVTGRGYGQFRPDEYISFEEAVQIVINALGLLRLGGLEFTDMTLFTDDADISDWARQALYAGRRIGLFTPNLDGTINPQRELTNAAAAAIINRMIDYMRTELRIDYTEHIVHFVW